MTQTVWDMVDARLLVVMAVDRDGLSVRAAADRFGVSKSQAARWVALHRASGAEGLAPRSRRPLSSPGRTDAAGEARVVAVHAQRDGEWGAKKIRAHLALLGWDVPAVSTVQAILDRHGLTSRKPRKAVRPGPGQRFERAASNELWQIDGTLHTLLNGRPFWVVDIVDDHSRYLTGALVGPALTGALAWQSFRLAVNRYGAPAQLLSDNGSVFTGRLLHGPTVQVRFERQVHAAGVRTIHGRPYHPQTQGKLERQHQTQNTWVARHRPRSLAHAQDVLDAYRLDYNTVRPHEGIGLVPPASRYVPGAAVDLPLLELEPADPFPAGATLRLVDPDGRFSYSNARHTVDRRWAGVSIGIVHDRTVLRLYWGSSEITQIYVGDLPAGHYPRTTKRQ